MSVDLYLDYISQPARAVLAICKIGNIKINIIEKRLFKGENLTDDLIKLNPLYYIPFIIDHENKDFRLTESHAIMKYLLRSRPNNFPSSLYPSDPISAAKIDEYLDWHHGNTRKTAFYILKINVPDFDLHKGYTQEKLNSDFKDALWTMENYFLLGDQYIGGMKEMSLADISAFFELLQLVMIDFDFSGYPRLSKWMRKMNDDKIITESNKEFMDVLKKIKKKEIKPKF